MVPGSSLGRLQHCDGKFVYESADVNPRAACDQREGSRTIKKKRSLQRAPAVEGIWEGTWFEE